MPRRGDAGYPHGSQRGGADSGGRGRVLAADGGHVHDSFTDTGSKSVHAVVVDPPDGPSDALVVLVPGLGLLKYALPTAHALARRGLSTRLLDLPGFGLATPNSTRPNIHAIGLMAAAWVRQQAASRPVVLIGHSTGSQAALTGALAAQEFHDDLALVMAGPTFVPAQRRIPRLLLAALTAYRDDTPRQLRASEIARGWHGVPEILLSGLDDAVDERLPRLRVPLHLTSGEHDSFAPADWLARLADVASGSPWVRTTTLPGSHNNLYTHPDAVADVIAATRDALGSARDEAAA